MHFKRDNGLVMVVELFEIRRESDQWDGCMCPVFWVGTAPCSSLYLSYLLSLFLIILSPFLFYFQKKKKLSQTQSQGAVPAQKAGNLFPSGMGFFAKALGMRSTLLQNCRVFLRGWSFYDAA